METLPLKYLGYTIALQEVPNEISLILNISGCPWHCKGCHSQYLWNYDGRLVKEDLLSLINKYKDMISCVCFMGGDQNLDELSEHLSLIKSLNLKTCLYTGFDMIPPISKGLLDYVKIGKYQEELGCLASPTTNQHMYNLQTNEEIFFYKKE